MADYEPREGNVYKVKLVDAENMHSSRVVFDVTPDLIENRNVNYKTIDPVHSPGQIYVYSGTSSRTFNVSNARFVSRTVEEATKNLKKLWLLRSWCMPVFGKSTLSKYERDVRNFFSDVGLDGLKIGQELLGKPPEVLLLSAYSKSGGQSGLQMEHINRVPVVIQQLSIPYPSEVDYIPTEDGTPMPTVMTIDLTLAETHSPFELEQFSLSDYRNGVLKGF